MSHSDHVRGHALAFGLDRVLLHTRKRMLEADGYRTDLVFDVKELREALGESPRYDIVVLCHSVKEGDRKAAEASVTAMTPPIPIYAMKGADSPQTFTETVAWLTGKRQILR